MRAQLERKSRFFQGEEKCQNNLSKVTFKLVMCYESEQDKNYNDKEI